MMKVFKCSVFLLMFTLCGCVESYGNKFEDTTKEEKSLVNNHLLFMPLFNSGFSMTTTPITKDLSITTRTGSEEGSDDNIDDNNFCNLSLIRQDNSKKKIPTLDLAELNKEVTSYGYDSTTGFLKKSKGKSLNYVYIKKYTNDAQNCKVIVSDVGSDDGSFGGPVYNEKGNLIGMTVQGTKVFYHNNQDESSHDYLVNGKVIKVKSSFVSYDFEKDKNVPDKVSYTVYIPISTIIFWLNTESNALHEKLNMTDDLLQYIKNN